MAWLSSLLSTCCKEGDSVQLCWLPLQGRSRTEAEWLRAHIAPSTSSALRTSVGKQLEALEQRGVTVGGLLDSAVLIAVQVVGWGRADVVLPPFISHDRDDNRPAWSALRSCLPWLWRVTRGTLPPTAIEAALAVKVVAADVEEYECY